MAEDYYGDGDAGASGSSAEAVSDDSHDTGKTAVVPSELCPGMKVGDRMVVEIVGVDDDSYEIAYKPGEAKEEAEETVSAPPPEGSMASMME